MKRLSTLHLALPIHSYCDPYSPVPGKAIIIHAPLHCGGGVGTPSTSSFLFRSRLPSYL